MSFLAEKAQSERTERIILSHNCLPATSKLHVKACVRLDPRVVILPEGQQK